MDYGNNMAQSPYRLDARALIADLGGYEAIENKFRAAGAVGITRKGMHKWGQRDAISVDQLVSLIAVYAAAGTPVDVCQYIRATATGESLFAAVFG